MNVIVSLRCVEQEGREGNLFLEGEEEYEEVRVRVRAQVQARAHGY